MRGALTLAAAAIAGVLLAASGEEARAEDMLRSTECPFGRGDIPVSHIARCYRFSREAVPVDVTFDVAVIARPAPKPAGSVIYIPGGPGDAPVAAVPPPETLLAAFADHAVVMFNPRGVTGSDPAPSCDFGAALWVEEFGGEAVLEQVRACRASVEERVDPAAFDAARIAEDVTALARALNLRRAGIYGVSYGTEVALHLLDSAPGWLGFAILDSVSLPGVAGAPEELSARDRFLSRLDALCFAEEKCSEFVDAPYGSLTAWAAQFDDEPLQFVLGPHGEEWRLDGPEMLDYLASLSAYPLGLEYALDLVDMLETSHLGAVAWMREDITQSIEFAADSLALTMEAYGDSVRASDEAVIESVPQYPSDLDDLRALYAIYRAWNRTGREEMPFPARPRPDPAPTTPVLVMSGLVDSVTPVEWANALHGRYAGLRHYGFPDLGHAVSFAAPEEATLPPLGETLACAQSTLRSFIKTLGGDAGPCEKFRLRGAE